MAPHSSTFAWKISWTEEPGGLQFMGSLESDTTERLHFHFSLSCIGEGNGNPLQCSCLENPRNGKPGCRLWGRTESDTAEGTQQQQDVVYVNILYIYIFLFFLSLSLPFLLVSWKKGGYVVCLPLCLHLNSFLEKLWH